MTELTSPGRVLSGRYRLVEPLARGGMATVWVADDRVLSRQVAVKILRADLSEDDALRARFRHEAIAAAKVAHPNIVATYDTGDDDGTAYIVMELVHGPTLRRIIDDVGRLPVRDVVRIGEQVADALDAAHRAGLVHRDVKPANVLVPEGCPVKVTDFGIAKAVGTDDLTRTGTVMGTARYLAPEQVSGQPTDARTDVYALGLLLFEMLCGHPPFGGDTEIATAMARLTTTAPAVRADRPDAPAALDDIVHRCLARRPDARYASADAVHAALIRLRTSPSAPKPVPGATTPVRPGASAPVVRAAPALPRAPGTGSAAAKPTRRKGSGWVWVVLAVLVVLGLAALVVTLATGDGTNGTTGSATPRTGRPPVVVGATSFDPAGDGQEDDAHASLAVDRDPTTAWSTEHYNNPLQATKKGVGLRLDLEDETTIRSITVSTNQGGWDGAIYVSSKPGTALADWGDPRASATGIATSKTFDLHDAQGKYILIWLTTLPRVGDSYLLQINDVTVA